MSLLHDRPLSEDQAAEDPLDLFAAWYEEASAHVRMPEAVALATASLQGKPSARMVLMKRYDQRGFVFHTNYTSRKASELDSNPQAALLFYWDPLGRQVRVEGGVERLGEAESDEYFSSRPRGSRIAAYASHQSEPIVNRAALDHRVAELSAAFDDDGPPRPEFWGGYLLRPAVFEFWQNRDDRLHDRLRYSPSAGGWRIERLQP